MENEQSYNPHERKKYETADIKETETSNLNLDAKDVSINHGKIDRNHDPSFRKNLDSAEMTFCSSKEDKDEEEKQTNIKQIRLEDVWNRCLPCCPSMRKELESAEMKTAEMKIDPVAEDKDEEKKQRKTQELGLENDTYNPFVRKKCETAEDEEEKIKGGPSLKLGLSILTEPLGAWEKYYTLGISISNWGTTIGKPHVVQEETHGDDSSNVWKHYARIYISTRMTQ